MNLGTANSARGNDLPQQYRFTTVQNLQTQLNALSKKLRNKQVLYNNGALVGPVCGCFVFGIDYNNGNLYYRNEDNEWVLKTVGTGGGMFDAIVDFSVNANPNTVGTTFSPNSPALTTVLYVSTIDSSQWTYNGTNYVTYVAPFWTLRGNIGTTPGTDFIGTIDNKALVVKLNNVERARFKSNVDDTFTVSGASGGGLVLGAFPGSSFNGGLWSKNTAPTANNYVLVTDGTTTVYNALTTLLFAVNSSNKWTLNSTGTGIGGAPVACALVNLASTTQGLLLPRMTKTQRDAITSPQAGLAVYQTTDTRGLRVFNGTNWMKFTETID